MAQQLHRLSDKVASFIIRSAAGDVTLEDFERLALEVFDFQYQSIAAFRHLCRWHGTSPTTVRTSDQIPAVPAEAFKHFDLFAGSCKEICKTFYSSRTANASQHSRAHFSCAGLELMALSIELNAAGRVFCGGSRSKILALSVPPSAAPNTIMVHGIARLIERFGSEDSRFLLDECNFNWQIVLAELRRCEHDGAPVTLIGPSFGFVNLFDYMTESGATFALPTASQLIHSGGYKGKSREIRCKMFNCLAERLFGIAPRNVVNLLGMTEMASQIYDRTSCHDDPTDQNSRGSSLVAPGKEPPPWVRTMLVNPAPTGYRVERCNQPGLLRHLDLANVERPMMIQSEDVGVWSAPSAAGRTDWNSRRIFEILGRVAGAEPRGCSLNLADLPISSSPIAHKEIK